VGLSTLLKHLTPKTIFLLVAVPITILIIWFATRSGTIKKAANLTQSVTHPSTFSPAEKKPKPPAGKLEEPTTTTAPLPPLPNWSNLQAANAAPATPTQSMPSNSSAPAIAPAPIPGPAAPATLPSARPAYAPLSYNARHEKAFGGGCSGQLVLSSTGLQFNCPSDSHASMQIAVAEISAVDENGVRLTSGKKLHFSIAGMNKPNAQAVFADWFSRLH
jgi:hypothetical protein